MIIQADSFIVDNEQDYKNAVEVCKDIKIRIKMVEDYWKDLKDKSYRAWKDVCLKEKELLQPFADAEKEIKSKMTEWQKIKIEEERIIREDKERFKKAEEERLIEASIQAEKDGKSEHSEYLKEQAEQLHNLQFEEQEKTKAAGSAVKTTWKARIIDESIVPIEVTGMVIRPIDISLLNKLAQSTKGKVQIAGVECYEDISISISKG